MTDEPQEDEILDAIEDGEGVVVGQTFTDKEVSGAAFGHAGFEGVRIGKRFELTVADVSDETLAAVQTIAEEILSNAVIEDVVGIEVSE